MNELHPPLATTIELMCLKDKTKREHGKGKKMKKEKNCSKNVWPLSIYI
jgi:hypothetical protein